MEKDKAKLLAERQARIDDRKAQSAVLDGIQMGLLEQAKPLPVGPARSAVADAFLVLGEAKAQIDPDPAHVENRRWEQRAEVRNLTREIKPLPPRDPNKTRER